MKSDQDEGHDSDNSFDKSPKVATKSKRINKATPDKTLVKLKASMPEKWQELHYLKRSIEGHQAQIKYLKLKLKQKAKKFFGTPHNGATPDQKAVIDELVNDL